MAVARFVLLYILFRTTNFGLAPFEKGGNQVFRGGKEGGGGKGNLTGSHFTFSNAEPEEKKGRKEGKKNGGERG